MTAALPASPGGATVSSRGRVGLPSVLGSVPAIAGVLEADEVVATAGAIAALQRADGMIPWFEGGHCDPWNHVEAAMALDVAGFTAAARSAYQWLADRQLPEGAWFNYFTASGDVEDPRLDTNVCAYVAVGVWHHHLLHGDPSTLGDLWPMVDRAMEFVLRWQQPDGTVRWSVDPDGRPGRFALLTGSSSILHAARCAVACAEALGLERPDWELAAGRLAHAVAHNREAFEPKTEFAMDWYYPVLSGALERARGAAHLRAGWDTFVMEGLGVRCVSSGPWVTAAETAECALALDAVGERARAVDLVTWAQAHRTSDGSYLTGIVYPEWSSFPAGERSSYTAAAVVLAVDALSDTSPAAGLFRGDCLPAAVDLMGGC
ncbi:MAG: prenyltransferase [Actinomycetota bacterium]|nr:prenyltransferase [Actinomycetota bacterium]